MNKLSKSLLIIFGLHCTRYSLEWFYWNYCARPFFLSLFTMDSPTCQGLRNLSNSLGIRLGGTTHIILELITSIAT
jgi:hypothetical protein